MGNIRESEMQKEFKEMDRIATQQTIDNIVCTGKFTREEVIEIWESQARLNFGPKKGIVRKAAAVSAMFYLESKHPKRYKVSVSGSGAFMLDRKTMEVTYINNGYTIHIGQGFKPVHARV